MPWTLKPAPASQPFDVVAFGENSVDLVAVTARAWVPGEKVAVDRLLTLVGGQAATTAMACARQGLRVRYVGAAGADDRGDLVRRVLTEARIDVVLETPPGAATRTAIVLVDAASGERTVLEHRDPLLAMSAPAVPLDAMRAGRVVLVDATHLDAAIAVARAARAAGIPTIVDVDRVEVPPSQKVPAAGPHAHDRVSALLEAIDVIIVPAPFLRTWSGEQTEANGLRALVDTFHPALAVVTLGAHGSLASAEGRLIRTAGFDVAVADTTGAGDAFRGGFAAAWLRLGEDADLDEVLRFANATAALACRGVGAMTSLPSFEDVAALVTAAASRQSK
jgi:sugar/nucleoside kinase (ribokinase family)